MTRSPRAAIAGLLLAAAAGPAAAQTGDAAAAQGAVSRVVDQRVPRTLTIMRATGPIRLDGLLDEGDWERAAVARQFIQNDPAEGAPATFDTEVRLIYDDRAIYLGVFAADPEPHRLIVSDLRKDFNTSTSDGFRVIFDTFRDGRNGYQFATNPAGAKWDAQMANEGRENNANWDGIWDVRARIADRGWYAEIEVPFRTLKFGDTDPNTWGINFERRIRRLNEDSHWAPLPRIYGIERVSLAGTLDGLTRVQPGKNLRVKPYALASANAITGRDLLRDGDVGFDTKLGVGTGYTWDFTVNTDFSQVEADEQQVNLSRFSLFFPEKRDFFLENSGIFQFGGSGSTGGGGGGRQNASQDMRLFFSRRIGLSDDGEALPILAGTRLTGRSGPYSLGLLNIQQRREPASERVGVALPPDDLIPATNFTALRVRRDVLANSDIGVVFLNKEERGDHYNRVAGIDANFRFGFLNVDGYAVQTFSPAEALAGRPSGGGENFAARGHVNYQSRTWQFRGAYTAIGDRFNDELGFVPRTGVDHMLLFVGRTFRPAWLSKLGIRETRPHWLLERFAGRNGRGLESLYQDWHLPFNFHDGGFLEVGVNPNVEEVRRPFPINNALGVRVNPGRYEFNEWFVLWNTNASAPFSFTSRYSVGDFYDGERRGYSFGPTVRVNERLSTSLNLQINDIDLPQASFVTRLITTRVNYSFSTRMFANALVQYNTDSDQISANVRFNVIHRPLSDLFIVYNERRQDGLVDRAFIAKMTYLLAF